MSQIKILPLLLLIAATLFLFAGCAVARNSTITDEQQETASLYSLYSQSEVDFDRGLPPASNLALDETETNIALYTTSPTKIIDMGLIFPACVMGGVMLLHKKAMGYILPPVMLIFLAAIAVVVVEGG